MGTDLREVLLYSALAVLAPLLAVRLRRLRVPVVAVEILLGLLFGAAGLGLLQGSAVVDFLSQFGLSFLMFLSGVEIDFNRVRQALRPGGGSNGALGSGVLALFLLIIAAMSVLLGAAFQRAGLVSTGVVLTLLMASSAPTVVLPVLKEARLTRTNFGQLLLTLTVLADVMGLVAVSFAALVLTGSSPVQTAAILVLGVPFAALLLSAERIRAWWSRQAFEALASQVGVRAALGVITAFMALSQALGAATVFGAFLAGLLVGVLSGEGREPLHERLDGIGWGYFIPFFFINLGSTIDLTALAQVPRDLLLIPLMLAGFLIITLPPSLLLRFFAPWRQALGGGFLLATRLSVTVAGVEILGKAGLVSPSLGAAVILASVLSSMLYPAVFHRLARAVAEARPPVVLLAGASPLADTIGVVLALQGYRVQPVAADGAAATRSVAREDELGQPAAALALDEETAGNVEVCRRLRTLHGADVPCVVRIGRTEDGDAVRAEGMIPFLPDGAPVNLLLALVRHPSLAEVLLGGGDGQIREIVAERVPGGGEVSLRQLRLPHDVLVLTVGHGRQRLLARGSTPVRAGDVLTVMGHPDDLRRVEETLAHRHLALHGTVGARRAAWRGDAAAPGAAIRQDDTPAERTMARTDPPSGTGRPN
jgi:Kef-type K+ transport system membrane component KefB